MLDDILTGNKSSNPVQGKILQLSNLDLASEVYSGPEMSLRLLQLRPQVCPVLSPFNDLRRASTSTYCSARAALNDQ
jgi:hypothetical protein